jgi:chemotaxis protein MotB
MASKGKNEPVRPIIVKKVIEAAHGGHHGGAWKVAYADFVTAMMAFFLLMWLLGATTEKQRKALADYFAPTIVTQKQDSAGGKGFFGGDSIVSADSYPHKAQQTGTRSLTIPRDAVGGPMEGSAKAADLARFEKFKKMLSSRLKSDKELRRFAKNVRFTDTREGLRIDIVDEADYTMFASGTEALLPDAQRLVRAVSEVIAAIPNDVKVRGHTDAMPYRSGIGTNNWKLSTGRAEATRAALVSNGVQPNRFARIEGVADREPYIPGDPYDARNRRISITLAWSKVGSQ